MTRATILGAAMCLVPGAAVAQVEAVDLFRTGAQQLATGQVDQAIQSFEKGVALKPDAKEGWYNLGIAYGRKRLFAKEVEAYQKALELDPNYVNALHNLGLALRDLGQRERAVEALAKAGTLDPGASDAWNNLGVLRLETGDLEGAVAAFQKAAEADATSADPWFNLAIAQMKAAEKETASERQEPKLREAVRACDEALARNPKHYHAAYNKGIALHRLGEREGEVAAYRAALEVRPDYAEALFNLGAALSALQRNDEALKAWEDYVRAASGDPNERPFVETARKEIDRLKGR